MNQTARDRVLTCYGAFAHLIEFGTAMYEQAYITAGVTAVFGVLDLLAVYVLKDE
ncbi:MAG: hypothetical protein ACPGL0_12235 [Limisphaerales bacterium]